MKSLIIGIFLSSITGICTSGYLTAAAQAPDTGKDIHTVSAGKLSMTIDAAHGAKILSFSYDGKNILSQTRFPNSYGSTFWTSPQTDWNWPPVAEFDRLPYSVSEKGGSLVMTGGTNARLGFRVIKKFAAEGKAIVVTYSIENMSDREKSVAPWEITRVPGEGLIFFDAPLETIVPPTTTTFTDKIPFYSKFGAVWYEVDSTEKPRKVNADGTGWLAYLNNGLLLVKKFEDIKTSEAAPAEAEIQVYVNNGKTFIELENQGRYVTLTPGETLTYKVKWTLVPFESDAVPSKKLLKAAR